MAGCSGYILAVGLLGCTRTCRIVHHGSMARLGGMYRTVGTYRGQTGTLWCTSTSPVEVPAACCSATRDRGSPRGHRAGYPPRGPGPAAPSAAASGTWAVRKLLDFPWSCQPSQPMGWPDLMESSSLSELFPRWGFGSGCEGIKGHVYQTLGSPERSVIVRSFYCLVTEV